MSQAEPSRTLQLRCPSCLERGSVLLSPGRRTTECPGCGADLPVDRPVPVDSEDFETTVVRSPVPVLLDFYAEWCGPCKWLDPTLAELARRWAGRILVVKLDTDRAPEWVTEYGVHSVPTVLLLREGKEEGRSLGVEPEVLNDLVEKVA